jgi:hypothetical protein
MLTMSPGLQGREENLLDVNKIGFVLQKLSLRVCPGSCRFLTELSEHETD